MSLAEPARVYALSGAGAPSDAASANTSSLPDILRRHGRSNKRTKRKATSKSSASINAQLDRIELIQDYEFPEASNKIKSTRDGSSLVATGTYKPHIRVWELDQLSLKFERHTNSENIDFVLLSDDWTKQLHLQTDRTLELHAQGGHHTRVRIPKFGRALAYHFPSAEALVGAVGSEVYRLNLDYGRFMAPYQLGQGTGQGEVTGCNALDVNPAHGLLAFGTEGAGVVELWDQRARRRAGALSITTPIVMDAALSAARRGLPGLILPGEDANQAAVTNAMGGLSVSALSSAQDGLNLAVGTSTGHVLLYDLRMDRPYTTKDQGFSLPIKSLSWTGDAPPSTNFSSSSSQAYRAASSEARDTVLSADSKGIKVWSKTEPSSNLVSISPQSGCDLNDVHHLAGSGLLFAAVEGTQCAAWYVPTLGPAPKWCSFLDRVTDEIDEEQIQGGKRGVYEDFKFLDRTELDRLNMSHLIGSNVLRPYMHGYFVALPLYERARLLANPASFEDAREKAIKAKLEKKAESRIRSSGAKKALEGFKAKVQVNKDLAEKAAREQDREEQRLLALSAVDKGTDAAAAGSEIAPRTKKPSKASLLGDERFKELFTNPEFQVDQTSREYALLNPSSAAVTSAKNNGTARRRTAVEEEEEESDRDSLDPDQEEDLQRERQRYRPEESDSDEGDLSQYDPRNHAPGTKRRHLEKAAQLQAQARKKGRGARLVDGDGDVDDDDAFQGGRAQSTFEGRIKAADQVLRRRASPSSASAAKKKRHVAADDVDDDDDDDDGGGAGRGAAGGAHTLTFVPSGPASEDAEGSHDYTHQDAKRSQRQERDKSFGAGLSKGGDGLLRDLESLGEEARSGRKKRREVGRSASKNVMRR